MSKINQPATEADLDRAASIGAPLEAWYDKSGRTFVWRDWRDEFRLVVTEILLQRTRADVIARFVEPFLARYPSWRSLAETDVSELEHILRPVGLHRRRAMALHTLAAAVVGGGSVGLRASERGIGQYVGRAVAVGLNGSRVAMVDSNFVRVIRRMFPGTWMSDYRYDRRLQEIAQRVVDSAADPRKVNWAVLDLGSMVCRPREPLCGACPLAYLCRYAQMTPTDGGRRMRVLGET